MTIYRYIYPLYIESDPLTAPAAEVEVEVEAALARAETRPSVRVRR